MPPKLATVAVLGLAGAVVAGCGSDAAEAPAPGAAPTPQVTEPGPFFGACGSVTDDEVARAFGLGSFAQVTRNSVGCEWELVGAGGPSVTFSWYRGSPIGRERAGSDLIGRPAIDVEIDGRPGFQGSAQNDVGQTVLCEIGVQFGGDFVHWSVTYGPFTPAADACVVARDLAELSAERAQE
ncbi:DUF3558 domain-containing protein [Rhodococcus ruber]|uniref:DUF3558 domain-containing protein n=1 Tax=Rhodococcus TaxID=1827 RepID=UPI0006612A64|nr:MULTISPECIES: DUF3558 domain-containing protein [Rhodococcus]AUM17739.1 DUF3558 domain-containing protein [Rhodococcus ruber]MDO1479082.1 DUF3558 domain-containing protein [Rhodococcus ruber]MDX5311301.1 DUF3558 domain-containing protein [Rhodococcus sp. (in: high G+C Gram-positive bacteria)]MDX5453545.1 DUF3558 domain-containing protein [Rhodococcus sp. (in: high G+C Gram-positive bacteria)]QRE82207.1 DUF3558 domain-containing protein [Rhodococcus ruber]